MENAGPYRAFRQQPPNTGFSRKRKRRPKMAAETPPLPQADWMRKQARTAPRDPSFAATMMRTRKRQRPFGSHPPIGTIR
ncbi:MAG: hypothetical protein C6P37_11575 [Caldibacillus debilis]|uniref:Uncharacterized protein n=1 Tax=Caldibacillus debilis TaxID=301148 RepID=A0A3E0K2U4_9BACI|nr:MAG: hypothetical protein C6P37_11575 [Caldibacillus debilis]